MFIAGVLQRPLNDAYALTLTLHLMQPNGRTKVQLAA